MERNGGPRKRRNLRQTRGGQNQGRRRGHGAAYITRGTMRSRARGAHAHGNTERQVVDGLRTEVWGQQKQSNDPRNNQHNPQYANYWAPLPRKRHIPPHSAQPRHTNHWAPRTRKRHHRPQRPTERSDPTQHAKGRTGDCPGPRKETATHGNTQTHTRTHARPDDGARVLLRGPQLVRCGPATIAPAHSLHCFLSSSCVLPATGLVRGPKGSKSLPPRLGSGLWAQGFWALPPGHTFHLILSPGRGVYSVFHVWGLLYFHCARLRWPLLATLPLLRGLPGSWRARRASD